MSPKKRYIISLFLFSQFIISYTFLVQKNAMYRPGIFILYVHNAHIKIFNN